MWVNINIKAETLVSLVCDHVEKMTMIAHSRGQAFKENQVAMTPDVFEIASNEELRPLLDKEIEKRRLNLMLYEHDGAEN